MFYSFYIWRNVLKNGYPASLKNTTAIQKSGEMGLGAFGGMGAQMASNGMCVYILTTTSGYDGFCCRGDRLIDFVAMPFLSRCAISSIHLHRRNRYEHMYIHTYTNIYIYKHEYRYKKHIYVIHRNRHRYEYIYHRAT